MNPLISGYWFKSERNIVGEDIAQKKLLSNCDSVEERCFVHIELGTDSSF